MHQVTLRHLKEHIVANTNIGLTYEDSCRRLMSQHLLSYEHSSTPEVSVIHVHKDSSCGNAAQILRTTAELLVVEWLMCLRT